MWRQPRFEDLDAPEEMKATILDATYFNEKGNLRGADPWETVQYSIVTVVIAGFVFAIIWFMLGRVTFIAELTLLRFLVVIIAIVPIIYYFYFWGWLKYEEAWYLFDSENEILFVIRKPDDSWEMIEIPYEQVETIEWVGGSNGRAIINAAGFRLKTNRSREKRFSSVTELWSDLAKIDTSMITWPIELHCSNCDRRYGHHIGTAQCPFDNTLLEDPTTKGRIDPVARHPDDLDRI